MRNSTKGHSRWVPERLCRSDFACLKNVSSVFLKEGARATSRATCSWKNSRPPSLAIPPFYYYYWTPTRRLPLSLVFASCFLLDIEKVSSLFLFDKTDKITCTPNTNKGWRKRPYVFLLFRPSFLLIYKFILRNKNESRLFALRIKNTANSVQKGILRKCLGMQVGNNKRTEKEQLKSRKSVLLFREKNTDCLRKFKKGPVFPQKG